MWLKMSNEKHDNDDLDVILTTFDELQKTITELQEERDHLSKTVSSVQIENGKLSQKLETINKENDTLVNTLRELHKRIANNFDVEEERNVIKNEHAKIQENVSYLQKQLSENLQEHINEINQLKNNGKKDVEEAINNTLLAEHKKQEALEVIIVTTEATVSDLQNTIEEKQQEHEADILKITMQFESKISKLQMQKAQAAPQPMSTINQEIFRQKQQHMRAEYEQKIATLKQSNDELSRRVSQLERSETSKLSLSSRKRRCP